MYKIRFKLDSPILNTGFVPTLDGVIGSAFEQCKVTGNVKLLNQMGSRPIITWQGNIRGEYGYALGSYMYYDNFEVSMNFWVKRWRDAYDYLIDWQKKRGKINMSTGALKNYKMPVETVTAPEIYFYFEGNLKKIRYLVENYLPNIGKKGAQGYGFWSDYKITKCNHDDISFNTHILRPMPIATLEHFKHDYQDIVKSCNSRQKQAHRLRSKLLDKVRQKVYTASKTPYWSPANFSICAVA